MFILTIAYVGDKAKFGGYVMYPIVGIVPMLDEEKGLYILNEDNVKAIENAGGTPLLIPYISDSRQILKIIELIDGLYLTGGDDIDPTLFGEEPHPRLGKITRTRDDFEIKMIQNTLKLNKPILAVCRGSQILNVALGGTMYQDIYEQIDSKLLQHSQKAVKHHPSHFINIERDSLLYKIVGSTSIKVNSRHHQANRKLGKGLIVSGKANDGIIEAIESTLHRFVLGVQWHPENMAVKGDVPSIKMYERFIEACKDK